MCFPLCLSSSLSLSPTRPRLVLSLYDACPSHAWCRRCSLRYAESWAGLTDNQGPAVLATEIPVNSLLPEARYEKIADGRPSVCVPVLAL